MPKKVSNSVLNLFTVLDGNFSYITTSLKCVKSKKIVIKAALFGLDSQVMQMEGRFRVTTLQLTFTRSSQVIISKFRKLLATTSTKSLEKQAGMLQDTTNAYCGKEVATQEKVRSSLQTSLALNMLNHSNSFRVLLLKEPMAVPRQVLPSMISPRWNR